LVADDNVIEASPFTSPPPFKALAKSEVSGDPVTCQTWSGPTVGGSTVSA
jgi:hypothetical protein